jgi:O-acetyl-ADP-ribose deacetylase (regulator of RNase III)
MVILKIINGDLLTSGEQYIAHQCNCVTVRAHGLSKSIADRYPYADVYAKRKPITSTRNTAKDTSVPGTIEICSPPSSSNDPHIICMFAQVTPGKTGAYSKYYQTNYSDTKKNRLAWFEQCLKEIEKLSINRVAMPYFIGCGLAGGNWDDYREILNQSPLEIILYKL